MLSKHRQSLRSAVRGSVLGDGLLERTRSTSLALLGATAAIGLAMVALALNQNWPLIAGAPIPGFGNEHQAVGDATVAARAGTQDARPAVSAAIGRTSPGASSGKSGRSQGGTAALAGSQAPQSTDLVVAHPTPGAPAGGSPPEDAIPDPAPVVQQPAPATAPVPAAATPVSSGASSPPSPVTQTTPEAPVTSSTPPATDDGDEHGHDHHSGKGTSHGHSHGHTRGGDDPETPEPSESPETVPPPAEAPPPGADEPEESEGEQSHASSWGHGGGHGYSHGRGHW